MDDAGHILNFPARPTPEGLAAATRLHNEVSRVEIIAGEALALALRVVEALDEQTLPNPLLVRRIVTKLSLGLLAEATDWDAVERYVRFCRQFAETTPPEAG